MLRKVNFPVGGQILKLKCSRDKEMDVCTSALVDGVAAECTNGSCIFHILAALGKHTFISLQYRLCICDR